MGSYDTPDLINPLHPSVVDKVDPIYADIYTRYQAPRVRADQVPYEVYNKDRKKYSFPTYLVTGSAPEVASSTIYQVPVSSPPGEIDVQVYMPTADAVAEGGLATTPAGLLPVLVDFHGGGFVIGGLQDDDVLCRNLCQRAGCAIVNVAYRTAPEHPHPTPVLDSWEALNWVFASAERLGLDASRVAVSGLSAGGCIAAVLAVLARDARPALPPLALQLLIVPVIDARHVPREGPAAPDCPYGSYRALEFAPSLPLARLSWFYNYWLGTGTDEAGREARARDFRASPILAESHAGLAPASIRCAGVDPLVDEGAAYHAKLSEAGTPSKIKIYKGQGHPFGQWGGANPAAREFTEDCVNDLKEAFAKKS
ncbi:Alpha/Beta hydrolase protein [Biscogniauxia marginata]|nr:Alpha/Beta hydrolase protein [Biscogniauxia marginata]